MILLRRWGLTPHQLFTVVVFVVLASLDNAARAMFPPLYGVLGRHFAVSEAALGFVAGMNVLTVALTAVVWGYWGDRGRRKPLLFYGTLIWSVGMLLSGLAQTYWHLLLAQIATAVGIGCIASIGFSIVSDFVPPQHRGIAMSFWSLSQGGGGGTGVLLSSFLGAYNWSLPFFAIAGTGCVFAVLYLFTLEPARGRAEPELASVYAAGRTYQHRIEWDDLRRLVNKPSNRWMIALSLLATIGYGSLPWMSRLFVSRVETAGYSLEIATMAGNLYWILFQLGVYGMLFTGYIGDRWQRRRLDGRVTLGTIGMLCSIPLSMVVFLLPMDGITLPETLDAVAVTGAVIQSVFTNASVWTLFSVSFIAFVMLSTDWPNRSALFSDVNLPEHRGTFVGIVSIATGIGLALGNTLTGVVFTYLGAYLPPPLNYAVGLCLFQLVFIPAGWCYYQLTRTVPADVEAVRQTLAERADALLKR